MSHYGYNAYKVKFREGERHPFRVLSLVELQDGNSYYVLEDENLQRHFLPAMYYADYHFKIHEVITCRVDRINCTGRIFLEPRHPCYSVGEVYNFMVKDFLQKEGQLLVISLDCPGKEIIIPSKQKIPSGRIMKGKISSINKGRIEVELFE